jgi:hypothetical protein
LNQKQLPIFSVAAKSVHVGSIYEHYKGNRYKILGIARHSESLEEHVVYQGLYENSEIWVRPLFMFFENIGEKPRFRLVD